MTLINKFINARDHVGVLEENPYVFPYTEGSVDACHGWNMVNEVVKKIKGLKNSKKITATNMRHLMLTELALLELSPADRQAWFKHMGHQEGISENVFQCPPGINEICRVFSMSLLEMTNI